MTTNEENNPLWGYDLPIDEKRPFLDERQPAYFSRTPEKTNNFCTCVKKHICKRPGTRSGRIFKITALLGVLALILYLPSIKSPTAESISSCSWKYIKPHVKLLDVAPISRDEFLARQEVLAAAIKNAGVDAFIAEPSASSTYYANISSAFHLSERPFLMILDQEGQFSYLVPKFEAARIAALEMVYRSKKVIEWHEEESPYDALKRATGFEHVMLDEHVRFMIASGMESSGIRVSPVTDAVQSIRAVKSEAELAILRGVNEFTVELVRGMQKCIEIGSGQEDVFEAARLLFQRAGRIVGLDLVGDFWAIVLFGEQAANPHGGSKGAKLKDGEFVLIDIGTNLHGYGSDVTRTFLPKISRVSDELLDIWWLVYDAQTAAIQHSGVNETCSVVDAASRNVIRAAGYGDFYTHRLGHGLGLEGHEHPYLNGANKEKLKAGQVVTNEPGIYVTNEQARKLEIAVDVGFGVRLEDAILVTPSGGKLLTGSRAKSPYEP